MNQIASRMASEIAEIPRAADRFLRDEGAISALADSIKVDDPSFIMTVARGSSDHAASYMAYAASLALGLPVASIGPSIRSVYSRGLTCRNSLTLAISQSGASRDIVETAASLRDGGSRVIAITNTPGSPLSHAAHDTLDVLAGPEEAVAATKSFSNSIIAGLSLLAFWSGDQALRTALARLPEALGRTSDVELDEVDGALSSADRLVIAGRGPGLGLAGEIALKLQETCGLFAFAYSAAEFLHGPRRMAGPDTPIIVLVRGASGGTAQAVESLREQGTPIVTVGQKEVVLHPLVDPFLDLMPLYRAIERQTRARGYSPDAPAHLSKVTSTT